jgi:hypothetical protein
MRGAERPAAIKWSRPFIPPLETLSYAAALQTFVDIADDDHDESSLRKLLDLTDNLPLAVNLMANIAAHEGCNATLSRWTTENTKLLSDGYDQASSLDISIMLSISSSRMTPEALNLLSLLSLLPDGLSNSELAQAQLPIGNILTAKATLLRTSLAYTDHNHCLKCLVPVREYVYRVHPASEPLKFSLRQFYHAVLGLWKDFSKLSSEQMVTQIARNVGNLNSMLLDGLHHDCEDVIQIMDSSISLDHFCTRMRYGASSVMLHLPEIIERFPDSDVYGRYIIERISNSQYWNNAINTIERGNTYFHSRSSSEQGK